MNKKVEPLNTKELADAGLALLFLVLANLFMMPINLWIKSVKKLAEIKKEGLMSYSQKTEFPVLFWIRLLFDAIVFLAPLVVIYALIKVIGTIVDYGVYANLKYWLSVVFLPLLIAYFFPVIVSAIKELFNLSLAMVMKIEKIEENTRK